MKKKGFTLVELLAVIAILSLLVIIALPNIMAMFKEAKKNSFLTECKQIFRTAQNQWMNDSLMDTNEQIYSRCSTCAGKQLSLSGRKEIDYYINLNKAGKVVLFYATDGTFQFGYTGNELKIESISDATDVSGISDGNKIEIKNSSPYVGTSSAVPAKTVTVRLDSGEVITISYTQGMTWGEWVNSSYNTFGFVLENRTQTMTRNGEPTDSYFEGGASGVSTDTQRFGCGMNTVLISYQLIANNTIGAYVLSTDVISSIYSYGVWVSYC